MHIKRYLFEITGSFRISPKQIFTSSSVIEYLYNGINTGADSERGCGGGGGTQQTRASLISLITL